MEYKVVITSDAEADLDGFIRYLLFEKKSDQAASNVLNDFEATKISLSRVAGSLKLCDNPRLRDYVQPFRAGFLYAGMYCLTTNTGDHAYHCPHAERLGILGNI